MALYDVLVGEITCGHLYHKTTVIRCSIKTHWARHVHFSVHQILAPLAQLTFAHGLHVILPLADRKSVEVVIGTKQPIAAHFVELGTRQKV